MKLPCEDALWYTLPQVRADLTKELVKKGMPQKEVAKLLGVTPAAVSQYMHKKRAGKIKMPTGYKKKISDAAEEINKTKDEGAVLRVICQCCKSTHHS